jgi:ferritin-like metal-binding protein YciE
MLRTPHELFAHRLRTMLWVEERLAEEILPTIYEHVHSVDLKYGIEKHLFETRQHVRSLERALYLLGETAHPAESAALLGLKAEHDDLMKLVDLEREDVVDLMHVDVLAGGEHLELAAYESLVATAHALGEEEIALMLEEIREQEEHALEVVTRAGVKLLAERVESLRLDA